MDEFNNNPFNNNQNDEEEKTNSDNENYQERNEEPRQNPENNYGNSYGNSYGNYNSQSYTPPNSNQYQNNNNGNNPNNGNIFQNGTYRYGNTFYTQPQPVKKKKNKGLIALIIAVSVVVIFSVAFAFGSFLSGKNVSGTVEEQSPAGDNDTVFEAQSTPKASSNGKALSSTDIAKVARASSVGILVYSENTGYYPGSSSTAGEGTGIIATRSKDNKYTYVLTCAHVISSSGIKVKILLEDGTTYDADIVGYDVQTDVGVLRVKTTKLTCATFGESDALEVGEEVYAVGNPGGSEFFGSVTKGIISAIGRSINNDIGYTMECIQHDAAINPGNSGGALLNNLGQVIGINSSKIASTEYEGMSFSVPIKTALEIAQSLIKTGYVPNRPKLGISYSLATTNGTYAMIVQIKGLPSGSLIIRNISSDSDLKNKGVQVGDIITAVNGKKLDKADTLLDVIDNSKVGTKIKLSICRVNTDYTLKEFDVTVKLVEDKGSTAEEETTTAMNPFDYFEQYGFGN